MKIQMDGGKTIDILGPADITEETTDAIVNAANSSLLGGGGVDGAIHDAGGPAILAECRQIVAKIGRLSAGQAVLTTGGRLPAKYVIHTVGPVYSGGAGDAETLASCHSESVRLADGHGLSSIAFPAISTGAFGYPAHEAAPIALASTAEALKRAKNVNACRFVLFDIRTVRQFERAAQTLQKSDSSFHLEKAHS